MVTDNKNLAKISCLFANEIRQNNCAPMWTNQVIPSQKLLVLLGKKAAPTQYWHANMANVALT